MPLIPIVVIATAALETPNAVENLKFNVIPATGALLTLWLVSSVEGHVAGLSVGNEDFMVGVQPNVEGSTGVADADRDVLLVREPVGGGKIFLPLSQPAAGVIKGFLLIEYT